MNSARSDEPDIQVIRPRERLFRQAVFTALALLLPLFAVLYWLAAPTGMWPLVAAANVLACAAFGGLVWIYRRARIVVTHAGVRERGFTGLRRFIPRDEIESVLMISFYRGTSIDTEDQLFVVGANRNTLLRMRGRYWRSADMQRVIETLGVPVITTGEPITNSEFVRSNGSLLYWYERRPAFLAQN